MDSSTEKVEPWQASVSDVKSVGVICFQTFVLMVPRGRLQLGG